MPFTPPLWNQGNSADVMSPTQVEQDAARLQKIEALIPLDEVKRIVESLLAQPLKAAAGIQLIDELELSPDERAATLSEFSRLQSELSRPDIEGLAKLAREQVVRYWVNVLYAALEKHPAGVVLGTELLPDDHDPAWRARRKEWEDELLGYLPMINRRGLQSLTRLFLWAIERELSTQSIELPRGMRVTMRPNRGVVAHKGVLPVVASFEVEGARL